MYLFVPERHFPSALLESGFTQLQLVLQLNLFGPEGVLLSIATVHFSRHLSNVLLQGLQLLLCDAT